MLVLAAFLLFGSLAPAENMRPVASLSYKSQAPAPFFSFIRGHKQGKGYSLQWRMSNASNVASFVIESTYEDAGDPYSNWTTVGTVESSKSNLFKFTDRNPLPGIINYRITAILTNNGGMVVSDFYTCVIQ
jgi:hypothetical protein